MSVVQTEIDGVPVFHADEPGPLVAGLIFRVGQADEPLTGRGITHLVEHLALAPLSADYRTFNGTVTMTTTSFEIQGEPDEVRAFLERLVGSLGELPFDRLDVERRVLRTEGQRHGGSLGSLAHGLRFGPKAYGTVDFPELGLYGTDEETVDAWRRRWFTRGNVALWLSGPPPEGLRLDGLPEGEQMPLPAIEPFPYDYPAWYPAADSYVALSLLGRRSTALWVAQAVLYERLYDRLRAGEGRSYEVSVGYERLTPDHAAILVVTDTLPEEAEKVRDAVSVELLKLARSGATEEELAHVREMMGRGMQAQGAEIGRAERYAEQVLTGEERRTNEQLDERVAQLSGEEVGAALREATDTGLWLVPGAIGMYDRRVQSLPVSWYRQVSGRTFERPMGIVEDLAGDQLIVGDDGVTITMPGRPEITVRFETCMAVQAFEDGARILWGADSLRLLVHPGEWVAGAEAVAAIDHAVSDELLVQMGESSGYEPPVETPSKSEGVSGGGLLRRWRRR